MSNYQSLFKDDKKILFLLETFAAKTHTIGNFMLIPKGDGVIKNRRFKEDLDKYIRNIDFNSYAVLSAIVYPKGLIS